MAKQILHPFILLNRPPNKPVTVDEVMKIYKFFRFLRTLPSRLMPWKVNFSKGNETN